MTAFPPFTCPFEGGALDGDAELRCGAGHVFPVRNGIPRFVGGSTYGDHFGAQWLRYRRTQLDSWTGSTLSADRARRCLGPLWDQLEGRDVLEAGCGAGRFTEVLLARGARVTSIDLSEAVDANQENFPQDERHRVAQADLEQLPVPPDSFDLVFCLGVVQHTPDPERTIAALASRLRPGGWLVIDHYSRQAQWYLSTAPLFRAVLVRLSPERALAANELIVRALLPLHRRARGPAATLLRRVSPVQAYYGMLPLGEEAQREWALLDTHDALTDRYKHFRTPARIVEILRSLGLEQVWCAPGGNGVEARGRRPEASA